MKQFLLSVGVFMVSVVACIAFSTPAKKPVVPHTETVVTACGCADGEGCICGTNCVCDPPMRKTEEVAVPVSFEAPKPTAITTAPLAPNGLPYPYRWAPPGPKPSTLFYNYTWMPDAKGSDTQGWWLMPNGQPAIQPVYQQTSACGPGGCQPRGLFGRR